eukprot:CAMPEP_0119338910 /NCGR_PEP_ID=MMETSP1333-20130426/97186_1 /TAXON_ID=418940 /ORGANISM="Scyphosphaera apsteinii, Strain RCC1455" /LENGTH=214 /DNA_ID=CAMNT_0007350333 /DNA_START=86 /DNA_END=730 /DNA_ORIENTATION=-
MTWQEALKELGLSGSFDERSLKTAYRERSMVTHPDKGGSTEAFLRVSEAFEVLSGTKRAGSTSGNSRQQFSTKFSDDMSQEDRVRMQAQVEAAMAEAMYKAEMMLNTVLDELFEGEDILVAMVDKFFGPTRNPAKWILKRSLKSLASMIQPVITQAMNSDSTMVTINGKVMSGKEASRAFEQWRGKLKARLIEQGNSAKRKSSTVPRQHSRTEL